MKAFFLVVGEKEYKDTTLRTRRRQCVFTKLRIESVFVSFVSFSFNKPHVSVPTRTCIRVIGEIRVLKKYSCHSRYSCSKKSRVQAPSERPAANKIRIESVFISFVSFSFNKPHVSVPTRTCIRVIGEIRVPNKFVLFELFVFKKL